MADETRISLDPEDYTLNEWIDFEDMTGVQLTALNSQTMTAKVIRALVYLTMRREKPDMSIEEAGLITPSVIDWPDANPTEPARLEAMPATGRKKAS